MTDSDTMTILERRTRSQVTLPDEILQIAQRSPLKDARSVLKAQTSASTATPASSNTNSDDADDELLLSPSKKDPDTPPPTIVKRSASPVDDEYARKGGSLIEGRELKRLKRDFVFDKITGSEGNSVHDQRYHPSSHTRNLSEPNIVLRKRSSRRLSVTPSRKSVSSAAHYSPPPALLAKDRAQSVPIFPSSYQIPHIDLRKPPPSPGRRRTRSRSPSKDSTSRLLTTQRTITGALPNLDSISDEDDIINEQRTVLGSKASQEELVSEAVRMADDVTDRSPTFQFSNLVPLAPLTPISRIPHKNVAFLSPLTPLPESPFPSKLVTSLEERSATSSWAFKDDPKTERGAQTLESTLIAPSMSKSRLPRPSLIAPLATVTGGKGVAEGTDIKKSTLLGKIAVTGKQASGSGSTNAFSIMMETSHHSARDKGKGKEVAKLKPNVASIFSDPPIKGKGKEVEARSKNSLKAKMKPKAKSEPKPAPLLVPIPSDEDEESEIGKEEMDELAGKSLPSTPTSPSLDPPTTPLREMQSSPLENVLSLSENVTCDPLLGHPSNQNTESIEDHEDLARSSDNPLADESGSSSTMNVSAPATVTKEDGGQEINAVLTPSSKSMLSKLPLGRKKVPTSISATVRITRSTSNQQSVKDSAMAAPSLGIKQQASLNFGPISRSIKRTASGTEKTVAQNLLLQPVITSDSHAEESLPPGSPVKLISPVRRSPGNLATSKSTPSLKTPTKTPSQSRIPLKSTTSTLSPSKIARSVSMFSNQPTAGGPTRPLSVALEETQTGTRGSSLSTLANALDKLRMPAPSRPNTSMGFNRDIDDDEPSGGKKPQSKDDSGVGGKSIGMGKAKGASLARSATLGANHFSRKDAGTLSAQAVGPTGKPLRQIPLFFTSGGNGHGKRVIEVGLGPRPAARRLVQKASKNPGLPSVMASPMKGGDPDATMTNNDTYNDSEVGNVTDGQEHILMVSASNSNTAFVGVDKNRGSWKQKAFDDNSSRRASMASQLLSQSLNSIPIAYVGEMHVMGPPAIPNAEETSPTPASAGRRTSSRIAKAAASSSLVTTKSATNAKTSLTQVNESLLVLKDCIIFVDVKTDNGDEAGSLFAQMLEGLGARLLTRVGQTCTHIIYKNGLASTSNRYRLLRDPKPLVVGIAWVVECVERRKKVDEKDYLIDLEEVDILGGPNKRRRSMLPKLVSHVLSDTSLVANEEQEDANNGDVSMEGSSSSLTIHDGLPPLERARRRKSMLVGLRT